MTWFDWTLVALWTLSAILSAADVGKARQPRTGGDAASSVALSGLLIALLLWTRLA